MTIQEDKRPFIQNLTNLTYIQSALRNRNTPNNIELNFQSPIRQHIPLQNVEGVSAKKTRNVDRARTAFQSVDRHSRANTYQKIPQSPQFINASLTLNPSIHQNQQPPVFNNTYSHSFQSPPPRKLNSSPFKG